jgi:hypothetical protein
MRAAKMGLRTLLQEKEKKKPAVLCVIELAKMATDVTTW